MTPIEASAGLVSLEVPGRICPLPLPDSRGCWHTVAHGPFSCPCSFSPTLSWVVNFFCLLLTKTLVTRFTLLIIQDNFPNSGAQFHHVCKVPLPRKVSHTPTCPRDLDVDIFRAPLFRRSHSSSVVMILEVMPSA